MVGEDEDVAVVGRVGAPPPVPRLVRPWPAHRAEHVPAEDPPADVIEAGGDEVVVEARLAPIGAGHLRAGPGRKDPVVQVGSAPAQGVLQVLARSRHVAVDRHGDVVGTKAGDGTAR